jgi:Ser/Thr protein kinase RdoA (MazF antagonist)
MSMRLDHTYVPPQRIGFAALTEVEKARAIRTVERACTAYGLRGYTPDALIQHSNLTARLLSPSGPPLALRLRTGPDVDGRTEFVWLQAVRAATRLSVVEPFASDYEGNTRRVCDDDGQGVECALFRWVDGMPLAADLTARNYRELGMMTAELHEFAGNWNPPQGLTPLIWDRTLYYEGTSLVIADSRYSGLVSREDAVTVEGVVAAADAELQRLAQAPDRRFLHGNVEMWNVLVAEGRGLMLLDFEDVMFGAPVQDVAITLYYGRERQDFAALRDAYREGYEAVRPWPVRDSRQMALLVAARAVMLLNHALQTHPAKRSVVERLLPLILAAA